MKNTKNIYSGPASEAPPSLPPNSLYFSTDSGQFIAYDQLGKKGDIGAAVSVIDWERTYGDDKDVIKVDGEVFMHNYTPSIDKGGNWEWYRNLFIGKGSGNFTMSDLWPGPNPDAAYNLGVGHYTLSSITVGEENIALGNESLSLVTSGDRNTGLGAASLYATTTGSDNTAVGRNTGVWMTSGSGNTFIGKSAGHVKVGGGDLTSANLAIVIGKDAKPTNGATGEIVIGANANGKGSNTVTLGHTTNTKTFLTGIINAANLPTFADDTAAASLTTGDLYKTATGEVRFKL